MLWTLFVVVAVSLSVVTAFTFPDCSSAPLAGSTLCDESASIETRARDLVSRMTTPERLSRLDSDWGPGTIAIPRLGVPMYQWINDALHGLTGGPEIHFADGAVPFNSSTSFPAPINFAATWNDENARIEGNTIGIEARAFANNDRAGLDLWTPNINPFRDPRWGRGQEVPGEDPLAVSRYAAAFVSGMQIGEDPRYWLAAANCKHYAAYDVENWNGASRDSFNAVVSLRELVEYFLPSFQSCVSDGKAASIMCSYNALNGVPTCGSAWLLQTLARDTWAFDPLGFVTSDCDAVGDIYNTHHYTKTPEEAVALALKAGCDTDCGGFYNQHLYSAYNQTLVNDDDVNKSVLRLTSTQIRLGMYDNPKTQVYRSYSVEHVNTPFAEAASRRVAEESFVLLKNNGALPLSTSNVQTIALIGPFLNDTYFIQGNYRGKPKHVISILEGLKGVNGVTVSYTLGCSVTGTDTSGFSAAVALAKSSDVTIFVGGIDEDVEHEGGDRTSIAWPGVQEDLIKQLEGATKTLIVLAMGGGQVDCTYEKGSDGTAALMWIGYPSQSAGLAIANTLFGLNAPAGRLPITQYPADYVNQIPMTDMELRPNNGKPGRTYMFYTGQPVYPFGHGLSYTTWSYSWGEPMETTHYLDSVVKRGRAFDGPLWKAPFVSYVVNVTNTGRVVSDHAVLLFVNSSMPDAPKAQLIDYTRIRRVMPGETRTIYFTPMLKSMATVDLDGNRVLQPANYHLWIGNAKTNDLLHKFTMKGVPTMIEKLPPPPPEQIYIRK